MSIKCLLSKKAQDVIKDMTITELLSPTFVNTNKNLSKTDKLKLTIVRESFRQYGSEQLKHKTVITSTLECEDLIKKILINNEQEQLLAIFLDSKNQVIDTNMMYKGGLNTSIAHPRDIFREAIKYNSARIIIAHNHPSGNPEPSKEDLMFTKRMIESGNLLGIELLDHFIVGNQIISLREQSMLFQ